MSLHKKFSLFIVALIASPSAMASIVFDNGAANGSRGFWSDLDQGQEVADNFVLGEGDHTITDVSWSGSYYSSNAPVATDAFTIRIFADSQGLPTTAPLLSFNVGNAVNRVDSGINDSTFGLDIYNYSASITATTLTAGTTYWLSIVNNTAGNTVDWLWENSASTGGDDAFRNPKLGLNVWKAGSPAAELAFQLNNTTLAVPEPETWGMLLVGVVLVGAAARRRRACAAV
jgi:hypothetical protein